MPAGRLAGFTQTPGPKGRSVSSAAPNPFGERSMCMRNAIALLALLAASIIALGGCDSRIASEQSPRPSSAVSEANVRYQVDAANGRIWWLTREGVFLRDARTPQKIAVPIPGWQFAGEPYGCLPALALGPNGEALVTSDVESTVWKIDPDTLAVSM